jgi:hypothetical protein
MSALVMRELNQTEVHEADFPSLIYRHGFLKPSSNVGQRILDERAPTWKARTLELRKGSAARASTQLAARTRPSPLPGIRVRRRRQVHPRIQKCL